jgi:short-subunit dehydrogenase
LKTISLMLSTTPSASPFAVVTGASLGLGKSIACELAERGYSLLLVSLPGEGLQALCTEISEQYGVAAIAFELNITNSTELTDLLHTINTNYNVEVLVNNAGIGVSGEFEGTDSEKIVGLLRLNIEALVLITHGLIPNLKKQSKSYILNISSMAAYSPIGYKTVYPASKAFVYSFSRGLNAELREFGIQVTVANLGPMRTNAAVIERINGHNALIRSTVKDPSEVAKICIRRLFKGRRVIMINYLSYLFLKFTPSIIRIPMLTKHAKKECLPEVLTIKRLRQTI